jgi:hypothetical protein
MDNHSQDPNNLQLQAHDNAVEAGKLLADAQIKAETAEKLLNEANIRMSNARKFESILKERQRKLDRAFVLLNKQKRSLMARQLKEDNRQLLIDDNTKNY